MLSKENATAGTISSGTALRKKWKNRQGPNEVGLQSGTQTGDTNGIRIMLFDDL